jgi:hypothetical protein
MCGTGDRSNRAISVMIADWRRHGAEVQIEVLHLAPSSARTS